MRLKIKNEIIEKELKTMRNCNGEKHSSENDLQKIFVECIDCVRKDIERRRLLS
jgi:hypothetical protein